jgi:peptide/nickel transport system permease protein
MEPESRRAGEPERKVESTERPSLLGRLLKRRGAAAGAAFIAGILALSYFAPVLANNKPLAIRYDGALRFTALRDLFPFRYWLKPDPVALRLQQDPDWLLNQKLLPDPKLGKFLLPPVPYSPYQTRLDDLHAKPSLATRHFFGCDDSGRDVLSRMLHGAKVSLLVGFLAVGVALVIGVTLGAVAGFAGGWVDAALISPLVEVMMCFPGFFFILTVVAVMDVRYLNIWTVMLIIGLTSWPGMARFARAEFLRLRGAEFVSASRSLGARPVWIALHHVLPNAVAPLLVNAAFGVAYAVLMEASLSFLGVGVQPPEPSWGNILNQVTKYWDEWWLGVFPGAAVFCAVLSYNLLGEGLRDALDVRGR